MEEEYNWELILKVSLPVALSVCILFYLSISDFWKWTSLIFGLALTGSIIYVKDRKKSNIFTAVGIVFLAALVLRFLMSFGLV